MDFQFSRGQI